MSKQYVMVGPNSRHDISLNDLHLCNNYRHLLMSMACIAAAGKPSTLVYLEDVQPIPAALRERLRVACPLAEFVFSQDSDEISAFANLPEVLPAILRRNLRWGGKLGLCRPQNWHSPRLKGRQFATGYLYHAGFFLSKSIAGQCTQVVLREAGLNNYSALPVPPLKAILRLLSGLPPRQQVFGEERWIDRLEVSHPDQLPLVVQSKATRLTFADVMDALPPEASRGIAAAFLVDVPQVEPGTRNAILLTQPLSEIGICSAEERLSLYQKLIARLTETGFRVYVKPHPLEALLPIDSATLLPASFPVEAWPYLSKQNFGLAIALCSASLISGARAFADETIQLLPAELFNSAGFPQWPPIIDTALARAGFREALT